MDLRRRLALAASACLLPLLPLTMRLGRLQIMEHPDWNSKAASELDRSSQEVALRAEILDREGKVLAQSAPMWRCFIDKRMVRDVNGLAARLSPYLGMPAAEIARQVNAARRIATLKTRLDYERMTALNQARIEGVGVIAGQERFYPNGDLGRGILGEVSSEGKGLAGLELALEQKLAGRSRKFRVIRDGAGKSIYKSAEEEGEAPEPVVLTIDRNVQYYAEEILGETARQSSMKRGMILVQDPSNGEILAMAAYPSNSLHNPIVQDSFEPGSTFKIVTMAAALEEGVVRPNDTFHCEDGSYSLAPGVIIHDHEPDGTLTVAGILERSSNIGIVKIAERLGAAGFYRYSRAFGFASRSGITLPGESPGELRPLSDLTRVGLAASSYGYGVSATPLQLASAYSAIANGGTLWEPLLLRDGRKPSRVRRVARPETMRILAELLAGVVERGTGIQAQIPGYRVAGKTGTARRLDPVTRKYSTTSYNASFVGFLPVERPLWTIAVLIEAPKGQYYGAQVAAPVFAKLGRQLLTLRGIAPEAAPGLAARRP